MSAVDAPDAPDRSLPMQGSEFIYIDKNQNRLTISSSVVTRMDPESVIVCCFHAKRDYKCVNARKSPLKVLWSLYPDWFGSCESCKDSKFHLDCFMYYFKKDETTAPTQSSEVRWSRRNTLEQRWPQRANLLFVRFTGMDHH